MAKKKMQKLHTIIW